MMLCWLILLGYAIAFIAVRSVSSLLALFVFACLAYTAYIASFEYTYDDVYFFLVSSCVYAICARWMRTKNEPAWVGCVFMSLYSLFYSYDSWVNWDVETWVHTHHESIILIAHALIMLLLGKVHIAMVSTRPYLFWRNRCNSKRNKGSENTDCSEKSETGIT